LKTSLKIVKIGAFRRWSVTEIHDESSNAPLNLVAYASLIQIHHCRAAYDQRKPRNGVIEEEGQYENAGLLGSLPYFSLKNTHLRHQNKVLFR
jgi:hypothetical protein